MKLSSEEYEALRAEWGNAVQGALEGYDCPICRNRGYVTRVDGMGNLACVECQCVPKRRSLNLIRRSGLGDMLARYTLAAYQTPEPW
ncbi:MAG: hypothetical protein LUF80_00490, partial [Oscillospiraceae bacterium]|nr:hypothetical protein [Oscillospiraceae bacterium]